MSFTIKNLDIDFVRIPTIGDGSCMFHSILQGFNKTYISSSVREKQEICRAFRKDLANILSEKIDGKICYNQLSRGSLKEISKFVPEASLQSMKNSLDSSEWGDYRFVEMLSNILNLNIFIIDYSKKDFYYTGDNELFIKEGRDNIIIMNSSNIHFDTVGVKTDEGVRTLFSYDEHIVKKLLSKLYKGV